MHKGIVSQHSVMVSSQFAETHFAES